jgi:hypothetical protein
MSSNANASTVFATANASAVFAMPAIETVLHNFTQRAISDSLDIFTDIATVREQFEQGRISPDYANISVVIETNLNQIEMAIHRFQDLVSRANGIIPDLDQVIEDARLSFEGLRNDYIEFTETFLQNLVQEVAEQEEAAIQLFMLNLDPLRRNLNRYGA